MAKDDHEHNPALTLLTPRHIDNLTDAIRNQNRLLALQGESDKRQLAITEALNVNTRELTKAVNKLVKVLSNGHNGASVDDDVTPSSVTRKKGKIGL